MKCSEVEFSKIPILFQLSEKNSVILFWKSMLPLGDPEGEVKLEVDLLPVRRFACWKTEDQKV